MISRACAVALIAALAAGCATTPSTVEPLRDGQSLKVDVAQAPSQGELSIRNASLGKNVGTGASSGSLAGGLWGLACGPFALLCVPVGAAVGALAGSAGGAAVGATASLPEDKAAQLRSRLSRSALSMDLVAQLRTNVAERARRHWDLASDSPGHVLTIELGNLEVTSTRGEQIGVSLRARATLRSAAVAPSQADSPLELGCSVPPTNLAIWLDESSDFVETVLGNCTQQLAAQLISEMARK